MISLTSTDHAEASSRRHGRSRAFAAYQRSTGAAYPLVMIAARPAPYTYRSRWMDASAIRDSPSRTLRA